MTHFGGPYGSPNSKSWYLCHLLTDLNKLRCFSDSFGHCKANGRNFDHVVPHINHPGPLLGPSLLTQNKAVHIMTLAQSMTELQACY